MVEIYNDHRQIVFVSHKYLGGTQLGTWIVSSHHLVNMSLSFYLRYLFLPRRHLNVSVLLVTLSVMASAINVQLQNY